MNFSMVRYIIGFILQFEAAFLLLPGFVGIIYGEDQAALAYFLTALLCSLCGSFMRLKKPTNYDLYAREGFASVALGWIVLGVFGAIPLVAAGDIPTYIDALFETVSGLTTTSASILTDVEALTHAGLFWRSFTNWIGGMGVFVFIMAVLPLMGGSSINLLRAESPGPSVGRLVPRVKDTAKILYQIYVGFTVVEIIVLCICKMPLFDAILTTLGTVGTGGFGWSNDSMSSYSPTIQIVVTIFMILSGVNYSVYFCIVRKNFKDIVSFEEVRWYLLIILISAGIIVCNVRGMYETLGETVRHAFFQVGSIITTTAYYSVDYDLWPQLSKTVLLILMFFGGCAGSTSGGIKISRIVILAKALKKELSMMIHPRMVKKIQMDGHSLAHETMRSTNVFISVYFMLLLGSLLILSLDNVGFTENFTAVVAALNNIGVGFEMVGPTQNFACFSTLSKIVLMFDMLAGRLELFPMLILMVPSCWKKY